MITLRDNVIDLAAMPREQWETFTAGYDSGYVAGIEAGRLIEREEVASLQRAAVETVRQLAGLPVLTDMSGSSDDLAQRALQRRERARVAFRADHARRRASAGGGAL
ncbi:hypothetical protein [Rudaeicoccus suwonensis]|uniref:Uncharacterized protein n=1 Tax=Rudaeicoccus suwonensis TaxID=657409 RepID=A0A561ECC3_9MICO|nr:hypothetical protein [Rudaeicoccus suwonensis]TWE13260.1 hypothetical protein BKA23_2089 [Rudaeicoccus suwonensis]